MFTRITGSRILYGRSKGISKAWIGTNPYVLVSKPSAVEVSYHVINNL